MMMWRVCWELLVTPSNMQRVMQSLTPRRVSHVIWPSLQNTCLLRSWLRRHSAQGRQGTDDQDSSLRDQCVHWPGCGITCDCAGPQWLVTRPRCRVVTSPLLSWCNTAIPGRGPHQLIWSAQLPAPLRPADPCSMLHVSQIYPAPNDYSRTCKSDRESRGTAVYGSNYLEIIIKIQLRIFTRCTCSLHSSQNTTLRHISVCGHRVRCLC